jgi:UDP-N-acetylglucosamine diphosphorylase / glucose-1-phosphate thymidylyltransferase / UDP-N-acetylgalactosamine diphosphorylase / glucosamine-1-phosphate N-acetyltransferase / galactosamine-1-phosphate N-acetyltransferase
VLEIDDLFEDLEGFEHKVIFDDLENLWDALEKINNYLCNYFSSLKTKPVIKGKVSEKASLEGEEIFIDEGVIVEDGVLIRAPAILGKNSLVRQAAYLRGNVIVGQNCVLGHATEIKNSLIMNNSKIPHLNYIGDSIIGTGVNLGAGVILANLKSGAHNEVVYVYDKDKKINTGLRKFGAILGDNIHIGCNAVLNPGTIVGRNTTIYPLSTILGVIPQNSIVKYKPQLEIIKKK